MILIVDNYDSFTYNLVDLVRREAAVKVVKNDEISLEEVRRLHPQGILISPGPGRPTQSGISLPIVSNFYKDYPILGVCLGHQILGEVFGQQTILAQRPMHGRTSMIQHDEQGLFKGLPSPLRVMRYHSLVVNPTHFTDKLVVTAQTEQGEIMGLRHKSLPLCGVQFHPESILSDGGRQIIQNWLEMICT
ncbi:MAG: aminodeoxychorismate/anthranilate synthase component II [Bacteroidota bacterium]